MQPSNQKYNQGARDQRILSSFPENLKEKILAIGSAPPSTKHVALNDPTTAAEPRLSTFSTRNSPWNKQMQSRPSADSQDEGRTTMLTADAIGSENQDSMEGNHISSDSMNCDNNSGELKNENKYLTKERKNMTAAIKAMPELTTLSSPSLSFPSSSSAGMKQAHTAKLDAMLSIFRISPPPAPARELGSKNGEEHGSTGAEVLFNEQEQAEDSAQQFLKMRASAKRYDFNRVGMDALSSDQVGRQAPLEQIEDEDEVEAQDHEGVLEQQYELLTKRQYKHKTYTFDLERVTQIARELVKRVLLPDAVRRKVESFKTVPYLNQEDKAKAMWLCTESPTQTIYFSSNLAEVTGYRLRSLRPTIWLDDEIVNGCMSLLLQRARSEEPMRSLNWSLRNATPNDTTLCERLIKVRLSTGASTLPTVVNTPPTLVIEANTKKLNSCGDLLTLDQFTKSCRSIRSMTSGRVHIYSSQFFQLFLSGNGGSSYGGMYSSASAPSSPKYDYSFVRRWSQTQNVNILFLDKLIVPCHVSGNHWTLVVANLRCHQFEYYDSLRGRNTFFLQCIRQYIVDEALQHYNVRLDVSSWPNVYLDDIPQQTNHCDCGVFSIMFADVVSENRCARDVFAQRDMNHLRQRLALDLLKKRIP